MRVVRGQERDVLLARQLDELRVEAALVRDPVLLDLDEEVAVAQNGPIAVGGFRRSPLVALRQPLEHLAAEAR